LNTEKGEYSGVNEAAKKRTLGNVDRVWLYTAFDHPHTSCGCFEAVAFYIPEVEGFGVVSRSYKGVTVNGLPFSTLADSTAGGRQIDGFHGMSIEYMRSNKFLAADGGWNRVVWLPKEVKERISDFIPSDVVAKIATEEDVQNIDDLKSFLKERNHPVVARWTETPAIEELAAAETPAVKETLIPLASAATFPITAGGFKIILKDAKIYAKKVIIRSIKDDKKS
jgi:acetyl-CoA decarbonylase/synthase complex subunit beta